MKEQKRKMSKSSQKKKIKTTICCTIIRTWLFQYYPHVTRCLCVGLVDVVLIFLYRFLFILIRLDYLHLLCPSRFKFRLRYRSFSIFLSLFILSEKSNDVYVYYFFSVDLFFFLQRYVATDCCFLALGKGNTSSGVSLHTQDNWNELMELENRQLQFK